MKLKSALLYCKDKYGGIINFDEINNKDDHIYRQNIDIEKLRKKINLRLNFSLENTIDDMISYKRKNYIL